MWRKISIKKYHSHSGKQYGGSLKPKIELAYDPAIPPLGADPGKKKVLTQKHACTPAALFIRAKAQKQPKCVPREEWTKSWYVSPIENSLSRKERNDGICGNVDEPRDYHATWSKSETSIILHHLYVESKKAGYKLTYLPSRNGLADTENKSIVTKGERAGERDKLGVWD